MNESYWQQLTEFYTYYFDRWLTSPVQLDYICNLRVLNMCNLEENDLHTIYIISEIIFIYVLLKTCNGILHLLVNNPGWMFACFTSWLYLGLSSVFFFQLRVFIVFRFTDTSSIYLFFGILFRFFVCGIHFNIFLSYLSCVACSCDKSFYVCSFPWLADFVFPTYSPYFISMINWLNIFAFILGSARRSFSFLCNHWSY